MSGQQTLPRPVTQDEATAPPELQTQVLQPNGAPQSVREPPWLSTAGRGRQPWQAGKAGVSPGCAPRPAPQKCARTGCGPPAGWEAGQAQSWREWGPVGRQLVQRRCSIGRAAEQHQSAGSTVPALSGWQSPGGCPKGPLLRQLQVCCPAPLDTRHMSGRSHPAGAGWRLPLRRTSQAKGLFFSTRRLPGTASRMRAHTRSTCKWEGQTGGGGEVGWVRGPSWVGRRGWGKAQPPAVAYVGQQAGAILKLNTQRHGSSAPRPRTRCRHVSRAAAAAAQRPLAPKVSRSPARSEHPASSGWHGSSGPEGAAPRVTSGVSLASALKEPKVTKPLAAAGAGATGGASGAGV